jgi:glycosyltransferase involved in cell wall biosynthesis
MKIRFLILHAYGVGGTIRTTLNTASELAERGHDVEVVSLTRLRANPQLDHSPRVTFRPLADTRPLSGWKAWAARRPSRLVPPDEVRYRSFSALTDLRLARFLRSLRGGVLIGTRPGLNLAIARHARPSVVRIGQDHMNLGHYKPGLREAMVRAYPRLDTITALTHETADGYRELLGRGVRVEVIPNGVPDLGGARSPVEAPRVIAAGRLERRKGFGRLLNAWTLVAPRFPDWRLEIFGTGPEKRRLARIITRRGLDAGARLAGYTSRLPDELATASIFALTSRREGFPMVVLEAMSAGVPVVAYDCPTGPRDIVHDGINGRLVPNGDIEALAAALEQLMSDASLRRRMGTAAVETASAYRIDRIAERWEALFEDLSAAKARQGF